MGRRGVNRRSGLIFTLAGSGNMVHTFMGNTGGVGGNGYTTTSLLSCSQLAVCGNQRDCVVNRTRPVHVFSGLHDSIAGVYLTRCFYRLTLAVYPHRRGTSSFLDLILGSLCLLSRGGHDTSLVGPYLRVELTDVTNCVPSLEVYERYKRCVAPLVCFLPHVNTLRYTSYEASISRPTVTLGRKALATLERAICTSSSGLFSFTLPGSSLIILGTTDRDCLGCEFRGSFGALVFCGAVDDWSSGTILYRGSLFV